MKKRGTKTFKLLESSIRLIASDSKGSEWDIVVIESGMSANKKFYSSETLRASTKVFEGLKVAAYEFDGKLYDHVPAGAKKAMPGGFVKNVVGFIDGCRFDEAKQAIVAKFHVTENAEWVRKLLVSLHEGGQSDKLGFSIDAHGEMRLERRDGVMVGNVTKIDSADELTLVTHPAAGGKFTRLVASIGEKDMLKAILAAMREGFPAPWFEGFNLDAVTDKTAGDTLTQLLEANKERAVVELAEIPADKAVALREVGLGIVTLQKILMLLASQKHEEAMTLVREWTATYPKDEDEKPEAPPAEPTESEGDDEAKASVYTYRAENAEGEPDPPAPAPAPKPPTKVATKESKEGKPMTQLEKDLAESKRVQEAQQKQLDRMQTESALASVLAESGLPELARDRVRELFKDRIGSADDVRKAVESEKDYLAKISTGNQLESLAGRKEVDAKVVGEQRDKACKAMLGMFVGEDIDGVPAYPSLHESFRRITGFNGTKEQTAQKLMYNMSMALPAAAPGKGCNDEEFELHIKRLTESIPSMPIDLREALTTGSWTFVFGDSIRRALQREFTQPPFDIWRQVVSDVVPLDDLRTNRRIEVGGFSDLFTVGELGTYPEFVNPTDREETYAASKRGGLWSVSWESILADDLGKLRRVPRMLGQAASRTLTKEILNTRLSDNPTLGDSSTLLTVGTPHFNDVAAALTSVSLNTAIVAMRKQLMLSSSERMFVIPRYLVVPPDLEELAWELTNSRNKVTATPTATINNAVKEHFRIIPIVNPFQTSTTRWQLVADPKTAPTIEAGFLGGRQVPELVVQDAANIGSVLTADKITWKIRFVFGSATLNFRSFSGSAT